MLYFQYLIFLISLITRCLSQSCILQVYDVCFRCSDNSHLYEGKCFLNILYCSQYQEGSKCISCVDGFQLKQNRCQGQFGLGNKNGSKVQDDKNTTENMYAEILNKLKTRRQIKSIYNNLPKDGWRQLSFQQSLKPFIGYFIMLSLDAVKYFQTEIQYHKFYFIWYQQSLYYRILFTVPQSKGLYQSVIQRGQPIQRSSLYYIRYFYPNATQLFIIQDENLDIVNRFIKNINRLYPQKRNLTPYHFYQSSNSQGLKFYRTIFFNPNLGLSQFVFNETDFNAVGPLEQIDSFENLNQEQTHALDLIKYYSSQQGYNEDSELYAMTKQTFNENFTTYNFTFISKDQKLRFSPNRISAKLALDVENGKSTIRKLRVRKIFIEGEKTEVILNYQCNFNYSRAQVPAKENFIVSYNLTGFQSKLLQSFKEIMVCVRPDNEYKIQDFVQFAKYDNTTHLFFELRHRNKTNNKVSDTYFTFYFDKKANLARLTDFYEYQNIQMTSINFYAQEFINDPNKAFEKYLYNLNKQFNQQYLGQERGSSVLATKRLAQLYQSDIYQSPQNSILNKPPNNIYIVSFLIRYPDEIIYEYEYVELRFQAKIEGPKMPLTLKNSSFKFTRTLKYPRQNYTFVSQVSYPVVFNQYNKRVFSKTNYLFFMMGKVYQSVQRPTFVRFYCEVTDKNSSLKLIFYEMDLSGFELTLIINMTVIKSKDEMENCNPFPSCQKLPKTLMNYSSVFQDPQISSKKDLAQSQFADSLQDLRFIYMRIFSRKQNDFVYEIGYGNRVTFSGFVIYISIISSNGLYLTKISSKQAKIGPGLYITIGDYYKQLDEPKISAAEKKRYIVKRSFHLATKNYSKQIEMYRKVTSSKLTGHEEQSVQYDDKMLKITGIWGQKWIFFANSSIFFIRKEQMECYPTVVTFDKIKYMKLVNDTIGTDLGQFSLFKVTNYRCIYYTDFQYYKVSLTFNRTKQLYNLSKSYQFETMTLQKAFDTELPMKYSSNYQMKIYKQDKLQKIQPASAQAKQYLNRIFGSRATALLQRRHKFSPVRLLVYELQNYGRFRMMVDINANIRFSIEYIENIDIEYRPQYTIKPEQLQQYNKYFDLVKRLYITPMLGKYAPTFIQLVKIKYINYRQIGPINFTQFFFEEDNLLMYVSVMCGPDVTTNFCDLFQFQVYLHSAALYAKQYQRILDQNVANVTGMSQWKAVQKEIKKTYAYLLRGAKIVDISNKSVNSYTFFTARYSSTAGTLDVEATYNSKNNSTIIHSITPAKNASLSQMEGCKATKGPTYSKCLQCQKDYFLHYTEMCLHKIPNCKVQIGGVCLKCEVGYFRSVQGSVLMREPYSCD